MWKQFIIISVIAISLGISAALLERISRLDETIAPPDHSYRQSNIITIYKTASQEDSLASLSPSAGNLSTQLKNDNTGRHSEFFNIKATDIIIALFTVALAVYTRRLVNATIRLEGAAIKLATSADKTART
jgi:hypothetical protein